MSRYITVGCYKKTTKTLFFKHLYLICDIFYNTLSSSYVLHSTPFHTSGSAKLLIIDRSIKENELWQQKNTLYSDVFFDLVEIQYLCNSFLI